MNDQTKGVIFLIAAAAFWSFGGLWIKLISFDSLVIAGGRSAIAAVMIALLARGASWKKPTPAVWFGAVAYAGTVLLFVTATKLTTAANAILLQYTAPIHVALLSPWLLNERITRIDWLTVAAVMAGMSFFFLDQLSADGMAGNVLAIVSGLFFALTVIALRRGHTPGAALQMVLFGNILTALIGLPFAVGAAPQGNDLLYLVLLGVVQLGLGYILFVRGVGKVSAIEGALIPMLEPLLNPVWVMLFYGERPSFLSLLGGAFVIAAVTGRGIYLAKKT
ncbi:MAG: DMT family transporter [Armatimonadetes bacterium]|nr:DMT family transporter [Armatimonadota bacterium]